MKKINKISCAVGLIAAFCILAGCEKIEDFSRNGAPKIMLKVRSIETKSAANVLSNLQSDGFNMIAVSDGKWVDHTNNDATNSAGTYFSDKVTYTSGDWATTDEHLWLNEGTIHFWSYYPISLGTGSGVAVRTITDPAPGSDDLYFTYSQPAVAAGSDATNQKDIIFAGNEETRTFNKVTGKITAATSSDAGYTTSARKDSTFDITFYHALSEIKFCVSTDDGTFDPALTITKVAIVNAAGSGSCKFTLPSTFAWSGLSDRTTYSQNCPALTSWTSGSYSTHNLYTYENSFFMIPESDLSSVSLEVTFLLPDGTTYVTKNHALTSSDSWEAGKYYKYKIEASLSTSLTMSLSLLDWDFMEKAYDYTAGPAVTPGVGELNMTNESPVGSKTVVADTPIEATFTLDTPIGATWLVSVTNTDAFEVYTLDGTGTENPAYGTIQNDAVGTPAPCTFYIRAKPGIDRSTVLSTKIHITVRLVDGTYVNVDDLLGVNDWNIILNPLS